MFASIFNDVLGPIMRGPSSSHTAGSYHIAVTARSLLGEAPTRATFTFDPAGSYAETYWQQNADKAFVAGLLNWPLTDLRFGRALEEARRSGLAISFRLGKLLEADHPNMVRLALTGLSGKKLEVLAKSTGGGTFAVTEINGRQVAIDGKTLVRVRGVGTAKPVYYEQKGRPLFSSAAEMIAYARRLRISLGQAARRYESCLLGMTEREAAAEMIRRYRTMENSIAAGLDPAKIRMKLLRPTAHKILDAERRGGLAMGGMTTRAAARAMAVLHSSNSGGIVCAAPTGGSAGVLPGVVVTLAKEKKLSNDRIVAALFAAGAVGLVFVQRATFAAEIAGCQVEIGAAGAMAAAAVVEAMGGRADQACNAAAISLQNSMGSVCDLVQGLCEIPCHTRNAAAAAGAFACADLVLGGYENPIPLDETVDASMASGRMLPAELRVTSRGGLAVAPSARALGRRTPPIPKIHKKKI
jgi:L-serine dehydratase